MVDDPTTTDRRSREHARRDARRAKRQRRMNIVGTLITLAIVVLVALVATDTLRLSGTGPSLASGKTNVTAATAPSNPDPEVAKLKQTHPARPLSHAAPLRLWIGGDSISGELGFELGPLVSKTGIVQAHVDYKVSSGLASNAVRDWPTHFMQEDAQYRPESIVFMVGANDADIVGSAVDASGTPVWETKYRAEVDHMMNLLVGGAEKRTVFWVGSPPLGTKYNKGAIAVDNVMREEAAKHPTVVYVDAYTLFAVDGKFSSDVSDGDGNRIRMRTGDGVHLTVAGANYLASHVFALLNSRWNLFTQAATATPIEYTIEPAFGNAGGVHIGHSSGSGGSNGSSGGSATTTTPPTSAPSTTLPHITVPPTSAPTTTTPKSTTTATPPTS